MVRVAGLKALQRGGVETPSPEGKSPTLQLEQIDARAGALMAEQQRVWRHLLGEMAGIVDVLQPDDVSKRDRDWLQTYFRDRVFPVITPTAVDPARKFPFIPNLGFSLAASLRASDGHAKYVLTPIPANGVPRFVRLPNGGKSSSGARYISIENVVSMFIDMIYPNHVVEAIGAFRVIRDSDVEVEEEAGDLIDQLETALYERKRGHVVRVKIEAWTPKKLRKFIVSELRAEPNDVVLVDGVLGVKDIAQLIPRDAGPEHVFRPYEPRFPERVRDHAGDHFAAIRAKDILVHHPYETFDVVAGFLRQAARDPDVIAIKQTLYRTTPNSPIVSALREAAEAGKNVTALVELKARFEEQANLDLARDLERHGVQVLFGFIEYKTHAKLSLVIRREGEKLAAYTHVGTGNYHPVTARIYTDLSLFTSDPEIGRDAGRVFNFVTGYAEPTGLEAFACAPVNLKSTIIECIEAEIENARAGKPSGMWAKLNSLVHPEIIDALYRASNAGVPVDLIVRGICCLRPGVPGLSENIRVKSIVGRFLEHSRIACFANGAALPAAKNKVYISSADWMPRNLDRRVEVLAPIRNPTVQRQVLEQIMVANLNDNLQSWRMGPDGEWIRVELTEGDAPFSAHDYFMANPSFSGRGDVPAEAFPPPLRTTGARA